MNTWYEPLLNYGALGVICIGMGYLLYKEWLYNKQEKRRAEKRLEKLEDDLKDGKLCNYKKEQDDDREV